MNEITKHISTPMGIHRLLKEPYDDREIFTSTNDLLEYCNTGTRYNGQRVSCFIGSGNYSYMQDFVINDNHAIIQLPNSEHVIGIGNRYVMVYYYNPVNDASAMYNPSKSHLNYFNNPYKFSMLELLDVFSSSYPTKSFTFAVVRTNPNTKKSRTTTFTQSWNPVTETGTRTNYQILYTPSGSAGILTGKCLNPDSGGTENFYLIPTGNSETMITTLYVEASEYLKAMGVHSNG